MLSRVQSWDDFTLIDEEIEQDTPQDGFTTFAAILNDAVFYGQVHLPRAQVTLEQANECLRPMPDEEIFPRWDETRVFTRCLEIRPMEQFVKRPSLGFYGIFKKHNVVRLLREALIEEAEAMETMESHPHPNIVRYHGCLVRDGYVTGLVFDRHVLDLGKHYSKGNPLKDPETFMRDLESAIHHLHSIGWAHNDLQPCNIMVSQEENPILIDFGSARPVGKPLGTSRGTKDWIDCDMKDYTLSEKQHDLSALVKLCSWLEARAQE